MSLQHAAKHLSAHGRGPDTTLVHMSEDEVKSLNDIAMAHGGHLTINPDTGLPEAGFLSSILPMLAGGALTVMSGGAINPLTAGLLVGGGTAVVSGDLKKGLIAGLGAYGGGGIGSALAQSGMQAAAAAAPGAAGTAGQNLSAVGNGISSLTSPEGRAAFMTNLENTKFSLGPKTMLGAAAVPVISEAMKPKPVTPIPTDSDPGQQFDYAANPTTPTPTADPYGREQKYFNSRYTPRMAGGGLSDAQYNLGGYSDGGRLLRGPGDGVSDSIPAVIGKKQPARLADGEFVVPARIVSELGNGSTEAGARKLYAMMDRIQKARGSTVGKGKVAKNSRAEKHLPA